MNKIKLHRVMAIAPSTRGFGVAVIDAGETLVDWGVRSVKSPHRTTGALAKAEKLLAWYLPDVLVLADHKGTRRAKRIITLTDELAALAKARNIKVRRFTRAQVHRQLVNDPEATKRNVAIAIAELFSDELKPRLPPKRKAYMNESANVDVFDAVGLALMPGRTGKKAGTQTQIAEKV